MSYVKGVWVLSKEYKSCLTSQSTMNIDGVWVWQTSISFDKRVWVLTKWVRGLTHYHLYLNVIKPKN